MSRSFLVLLVLGLASCQRRKLNYRDCGEHLQDSHCRQAPCIAHRTTTSKTSSGGVRLFFLLADQNSDMVTLDVRVKMFGFDMPVPGIETDLCNGVIKCPVVKGQTYKGTIIFPVRAASPQV
ncbi:conserved hypothetical protein, partial [Ixodes scapularis]